MHTRLVSTTHSAASSSCGYIAPRNSANIVSYAAQQAKYVPTRVMSHSLHMRNDPSYHLYGNDLQPRACLMRRG